MEIEDQLEKAREIEQLMWKTIEGYLGGDYLVKSSFGHVRDLLSKELSVDTGNKFTPKYEIPSDKKKVVDELKKLSLKKK